MSLEILQIGDPLLRRPTRQVEPAEIVGDDLQELVAAMRDTMRAEKGVGLAAPQIGRDVQLVLIEDTSEYLAGISSARLMQLDRHPIELQVLFNPVVRPVDTRRLCFFEACLSVPGYVGAVARSTAVQVDALNGQGEPVTFVAQGWHARIIQHEIDHLDGVLYSDKILAKSLMTSAHYKAHWSDKTATEVAEAFELQ